MRCERDESCATNRGFSLNIGDGGQWRDKGGTDFHDLWRRRRRRARKGRRPASIGVFVPVAAPGPLSVAVDREQHPRGRFSALYYGQGRQSRSYFSIPRERERRQLSRSGPGAS